jgi:hypothetical protein
MIWKTELGFKVTVAILHAELNGDHLLLDTDQSSGWTSSACSSFYGKI